MIPGEVHGHSDNQDEARNDGNYRERDLRSPRRSPRAEENHEARCDQSDGKKGGEPPQFAETVDARVPILFVTPRYARGGPACPA